MKNQPDGCYLGIEWVGEQLRAGVFDSHWRLRGKASRSAKTQRGLGEVVKRIARCALDAVDEADLQPEQIAASALLMEGYESDQVWGPQQINQLAGHLSPPMSSNLLTAGRVPIIMGAVHEHEFSGAPQSWLGLFSEPEPALFAAQRAQPGQVKAMIAGPSPAKDGAAAAAEFPDLAGKLLSAVQLSRPDLLLLLGPGYEDAGAPGSKRILEMLSAAGLNLPVHTSRQGIQVGVWAAARLAARTFA